MTAASSVEAVAAAGAGVVEALRPWARGCLINFLGQAGPERVGQLWSPADRARLAGDPRAVRPGGPAGDERRRRLIPAPRDARDFTAGEHRPGLPCSLAAGGDTMGPDFGPDGSGPGFPPAHGPGMVPGFGPDGPRFHHGPPHFLVGMDWWPVVGSLLMTALVLAVLWSGGLALLMGQLVRGPRAERVRVDWRGRWQNASPPPGRRRGLRPLRVRRRGRARHPGLADVRQPPTARFVDAFAEAVALATERYPARAFARRFIEAVEREEQAWAAAVGAAERSRDARFSPAERDLLDQTRRLPRVVGSSEYEQERHTALRQALRKLRDLERRTGWQLPSPPPWRWRSGPAACWLPDTLTKR